jgi:hypothetical protein
MTSGCGARRSSRNVLEAAGHDDTQDAPPERLLNDAREEAAAR